VKKITAAGFNPARQKVMTFEKITPGKVNRALSLEEFPSGKGINFCRASACYGKADTFLIQFCGKENGLYVNEQLKKEGINFYSVQTESPTRCCNTCIALDSNEVTELIEPSYPATAKEVEEYIFRYTESLKSSSAAVFCGTLPTGTDNSLYAKLAKLTAEAKLPLLVDAWRDVDDIFSSGAEILLKINREELSALTGKDSVVTGLQYLKSRWGICKAAITDGPDKAYAFDGNTIMEYTLPVLEKVVNPIGCGDTASAVLLSETVNGRDLFSAFRCALGAASANCLTSLCGSFLPLDAETLTEKTVMTTL
jgi:fructose-1-phosphate kinase PfkB-like protein